MSQKDKLVQRFCTIPKDFTWQELEKLLQGFGFKVTQKGKTSGSRIRFRHAEYPSIDLHKPHPGNIVKEYIIKYLKKYFEDEGLL